ncbi:Transposase-like protein, ISSpn_AP200_1 [Streptococcus pneumoniae AP200]|nr:Transposase-like protein, ISSpn_AP200_1 [Streptococcus pneumoniae AP200]
MLYVGIDIAKNKHDVTALNVPGKTVLKPLTFSNNKAGFELLDLSLRRLNQDCLIALENTGHYAFNLLNFLHEQGYKGLHLHSFAHQGICQIIITSQD